MSRKLVVFVLADEHYGVDIAAVESIIKLQPITAVPRAPAFVEGVTNLRGQVLPVIDLRQRLGLAASEPSKDSRIVVIEMEGTKVGMVVDAVSEVLSAGVPEEAIEPPSPIVVTIDSSYITGIAKVDERLIILLDLQKVLSPEERADLKAMPDALKAEEAGQTPHPAESAEEGKPQPRRRRGRASKT
jgi:purine-binding chemotaxis protein CheW